MQNLPYYKDLLYIYAQDLEYEKKYEIAIDIYKRIVNLGDEKGIKHIANIYITQSALKKITKSNLTLDFKKLLSWIKKLSNRYPEEIFKVVYLFLAFNILSKKEKKQYLSFLKNTNNKIAKKYFDILSKGEIK